mgnify:CR=1 FL=1
MVAAAEGAELVAAARVGPVADHGGIGALVAAAVLAVLGFLAGLGGRDVTPEDVALMFKKTIEAAGMGRAASRSTWIGTRGVQP